MEYIRLVNPDLVSITELSELGRNNFLMRDHPRPTGYSAMTRLHMGRLSVPVLNDTGATCSCITEEQLTLVINHSQKMVSDGLMRVEDYNYPVVHLYQYREPTYLKGAEAKSTMMVQYAALLRVEFIPEGSDRGPTKDIYFKVFKKGTCGVIGAVLGWPNLDFPSKLGGEGLGWVNEVEGARYTALNVTVPRLDDQRKATYLSQAARYSCLLYTSPSPRDY